MVFKKLRRCEYIHSPPAIHRQPRRTSAKELNPGRV
jgi:hypothetical protein